MSGEPQVSDSTHVEEAGDPTVPLLLNYDDSQGDAREIVRGQCPEEAEELESPTPEKLSIVATVTDPLVLLFLALVRLRNIWPGAWQPFHLLVLATDQHGHGLAFQVAILGSAYGIIDTYLFLYLQELHASEALMGLSLFSTSICECSRAHRSPVPSGPT